MQYLLYVAIEIVVLAGVIRYLPTLAPKKYVSDRALDIAVGTILAYGMYAILATALLALSRIL